MAYLSLYRKYRPKTFAEIVGQEHVSTTLSNAIAEDRVAHAYLFTGPRGTGKTSTARILAKALNCAEGPTPQPCGVCGSCIAIDEGSSLDVIELDAASHSGVDDTREILSGVPLATAGSRKKVYVIDEVHMLTSQSFNALLKTLEEPPEHVVFVLATTEAHKVLPTIVSRTQRFDFRRISADVIEQLVSNVAKLETIDIEQQAIEIVARHADGSARDALSSLEQLASFGAGVTAEAAEAMLGHRSEDALFEVFDAIAGEDPGAIFRSIQVAVALGADMRQFAFDALEHARSLLLLKAAPEGESLLDAPAEDRARLAAQAEGFSPATLLRALDLLGDAIIDMRNAPNHRLLVEVALVRAASPDTDPSANGLLGRIERLERRLAIAGESSVAAPVETPSPPAARAKPAKTAKPAKAAPPKPAQTVAAVPEEPPAAVPVAPAPAAPAEVGLAHFRDVWPAVMKELNKMSKRVGAYLHASRPVAFDDGVLVVEVQADFHAKAMGEPENSEKLRQAIHSALGVTPRVRFGERGREVESAAAPEPDASEIAEARPVEGTEADPIELVKRGLGAEVVEHKENDS